MNPFKLYQIYMCVKLHMSGAMNICNSGLKLKGHTKAKFEKRPDHKFFYCLANQIPEGESLGFMLSLFSDQDLWVGDMVLDGRMQKSLTQYNKWKDRMRHPVEHISTDLFFIESNCRDNDIESPLMIFEPRRESPPFALNLIMRGAIYPETWCIMNHVLGFVEATNESCPILRDMDPSWRMVSERMNRYSAVIFKYIMDPEEVKNGLMEKHPWITRNRQ